MQRFRSCHGLVERLCRSFVASGVRRTPKCEGSPKLVRWRRMLHGTTRFAGWHKGPRVGPHADRTIHVYLQFKWRLRSVYVSVDQRCVRVWMWTWRVYLIYGELYWWTFCMPCVQIWIFLSGNIYNIMQL